MIPLWKLAGRIGNNMFQFAYLYAQVREGVIPDFYLQDKKYFEKYESEIRLLFGDGIFTKNNKVSIHVRRGDYVNNTFYTDLSKTDYYQNAIAMFPRDSFIIFSDDIDWCKNYFIGDRFEFFHGDEIADMNLMASCKHNIIANSSFSWWAAYLNPNPDKKVIAPKNWFSDKIERTVCPKEWIRI